jgi:hypothetical protein
MYYSRGVHVAVVTVLQLAIDGATGLTKGRQHVRPRSGWLLGLLASSSMRAAQSRDFPANAVTVGETFALADRL